MGESSLMFAYVRLCSPNGKKNIGGAGRGHRGCGARPPLGMQNARQTDHGGSRLRQIKANQGQSRSIKGSAARTSRSTTGAARYLSLVPLGVLGGAARGQGVEAERVSKFLTVRNLISPSSATSSEIRS